MIQRKNSNDVFIKLPNGKVLQQIRCRCIKCGKIFYVSREDLKYTLGCGCARQGVDYVGIMDRDLRAKLTIYKKGAYNRDYEWKLSDEDAIHLMKQCCYYCGDNIIFDEINKRYKLNGIDRLINTESYTLQNSVSCCGFCNMAKSTNSAEEFLNKVKKIAINLQLEQPITLLEFYNSP